MSENKQKYELLLLLPLTGTDNELKEMAGKVEARITHAGGVIYASNLIFKGRMAYAIDNKLRQGYYQAIQFEIEPRALAEMRQSLTLSGEVVRFTIAKILGEFKVFMPSAPKASNATPRPTARSARSIGQSGYGGPLRPPIVAPLPAIASAALVQDIQESVKPSDAPKVSMEELDKRLEEILGA